MQPKKVPVLGKYNRWLTRNTVRLVVGNWAFCYDKREENASAAERMNRYDHGGKNHHAAQAQWLVSGGAGRKTGGFQTGSLQVGVRSFPKLKIPHQSHADFCSTDTAGGLDNKKRRYAPRRGVAYRLFLWGVSKGGNAPIWHTTLRSKV